MTDDTQSLQPGDPARQARLEAVLAEYLRRVEAGEEVDRQAILALHPDLAADLREFFANQAHLARIVGQGVAGPPDRGSSPARTARIRYFGDYEIQDEIAQGGMGIVYKARQVSLNRPVAVKMILAGQLANDSEVKRFRSEAEAAANLRHPGVVPIYEVGIQDGQHYFSMEYVEGRTLSRLARDDSLSATKAAEYVREMAEIVQFAHDQGVLHRDLKPSNILIDADDRVRITDFGLAKRVTGDSDLTLTGQVIGTPSYMPPEQAAAQHAIIGATSDVYALGAILYELLTGRPPFRSENIGETLRQVQHDDPVRPRLLAPKLPRDLETICLKCLEKEPRRRYATAQELADELGRFLRGEPIRARPIGVLSRMWRWCKREPVVASLAAALTIALVAGAAFSTYFAVDAYHQADQAKRAAIQSKASEASALQAAAREKAAAEVARRRLGQIEKSNEILGSILADLDPQQEEKDGKPLRAILAERLKHAVAELDAEAIGDPLAVARLQMILARSLLGLGQPNEAIVLCERARETFRSQLGPENSETLESTNNLAVAYDTADRVIDTLPLYQEVLRICSAKNGLENRETLIVMNNLAGTYRRVGRLAEAVSQHDKTLKICKAALGPDDPITLVSMRDLALALKEAGQIGEAVRLLEEALKRQQAQLGETHYETLASMVNLGGAYLTQGRFSEAISLLDKCRELSLAELGAKHRVSLMSKGGLGSGYLAVGRYSEAITMLEETLDLQKQTLGTQHRDSLAIANDLAGAYQAAGRLTDAVSLFEETLALRKSRLGPDHPDTLKGMCNLANAYTSIGRHSDAALLLDDALKRMTITLASDHPNRLMCMNNLGVANLAQGRVTDAVSMLEESFKVQQGKLGPKHPSTLLCMCNLANAYQAANRFSEATSLFEEALATRRSILGPTNPDTLASMNYLAAAYIAAGRSSEAMPLLEETVRHQRDTVGRDNPNTLSTMNNLAAAYRVTARYDEAVTLFDETLKLCQSRLGVDHPNTLTVMKNLALAQLAAKQTEKGLGQIREWVAAQRVRLAADETKFAAVLSQIGAELLRFALPGEAEELLRESLTIHRQREPDAWITFHTQSLLGSALAAQDKLAEAETLLVQGYEGMKQRQAMLTAQERKHLVEAAERLVKLYEALGQDDQVTRWRNELALLKSPAQPPKAE